MTIGASFLISLILLAACILIIRSSKLSKILKIILGILLGILCIAGLGYGLLSLLLINGIS